MNHRLKIPCRHCKGPRKATSTGMIYCPACNQARARLWRLDNADMLKSKRETNREVAREKGRVWMRIYRQRKRVQNVQNC